MDSGLGEALVGGGLQGDLRQPVFSIGLKGADSDNFQKVPPASSSQSTDRKSTDRQSTDRRVCQAQLLALTRNLKGGRACRRPLSRATHHQVDRKATFGGAFSLKGG